VVVGEDVVQKSRLVVAAQNDFAGYLRRHLGFAFGPSVEADVERGEAAVVFHSREYAGVEQGAFAEARFGVEDDQLLELGEAVEFAHGFFPPEKQVLLVGRKRLCARVSI